MRTPANDFIDDMQARGLLKQCTDAEGLRDVLSAGPATAYVGFDPTAPGLHVGHLVALSAMRRFLAAGNRVIALVGGATALVGDPSFRNSTRPMLAEEGASANADAVAADILKCMGPHAANVEFVDNADWLKQETFLGFMRDVGSAFTVARMTAMESVSGRLEAGVPVTMLEFSYMLLQAADFRHLSRTKGCVLQMGGSDQWGNICNGIELARRTDGAQLFGLTTPLLLKADGEKMGKTAGGAVWLSEDRLGNLEFWQFWRNCDDADVGRFLLMFTDISVEEARELTATSGAGLNQAKRVLADRVTAIVRGDAAAAEAASQAAALFDGDGEAVPVTLEIGKGMTVAEILFRIGFAGSRSEGRRLVSGGAVKVDGIRISNPLEMMLPSPHRRTLAAGKRRKAALRLTAA